MGNNYDSGIHYDSGLRYDDPGLAQPKHRMEKVKLNLRLKTLDEKTDLTAMIVTKTTGNANFPTPNPPLADLTSKRTAVLAKKAAVDAARSTLAQLEDELDALERELDALLTSFGAYLQNASGGDGPKILSAGVEIASKPSPIGELLPPGNLRSSGGDHDGEVDCMWDPVRGANAYIARCATSTNGPWTNFYTGTNSKCTAPNLTSGTEYFFEVAAVGAAGQSAWSDIAKKRAT